MDDKSPAKDEEIIQGSFFKYISRPTSFLAEAFNALLKCLGLGGRNQCPSNTSQEAYTEETLQDPPPAAAATTTTTDPQTDPPTADSVEDAPANIGTSLARRGGRSPPISRGGGGQINSVTTQSS